MDHQNKISWEAPEHKEDIKGNDWFWALGVIVLTGSIIAIIYANYFFAGILILGGIMLGLTVNKKPEMMYYELNKKGLRVNNELYPYERISEFGIYEHKPVLAVRTERLMFPIISTSFPEEMRSEIHEMFTKNNVKETNLTEHTAEKIVKFLGI